VKRHSRFSKKASLDMSISTIVVVILAMTLLGLGLGFIRNMFSNITDTTEQVNEDTKQKITDDMATSDKKVSFPRTDIVINKGDDLTLTVGIRNKRDSPLCYRIIFEGVEDNTGDVFDAQEWFKYKPGPEHDCEVITPAESVVKSVKLQVPKGTAGGVYLLQFKVIDAEVAPGDSPDYEIKDLFITVRG